MTPFRFIFPKLSKETQNHQRNTDTSKKHRILIRYTEPSKETQNHQNTHIIIKKEHRTTKINTVSQSEKLSKQTDNNQKKDTERSYKSPPGDS